MVPKAIFMLRAVTSATDDCGLQLPAEVPGKYGKEICATFADFFDAMPLSATIKEKFIAFRGGVSPNHKTICDINKLGRFKKPTRWESSN